MEGRALPPLLRLAARQLGAGQHAAASSLAAGLGPTSQEQQGRTASTSTAATAPRPPPAVIPASRLQGPHRRGDPRYYAPSPSPSPHAPSSSPSAAAIDGGYSKLRRRWEAGAPLPKPNARRMRLRNQEAVRKRPAAAAGHASWLPLPAEARGELRAALEASGLSPAAAHTVADAAAGRPQGTRGPAPPADPAELARRVRHVAAAQRAAAAAAAAAAQGGSSSPVSTAHEPLPLAGLDLDAALRRRDRAGLGSGCGDQRGALLWLSPGRFDARVRYLDARLTEAARPARDEAAAAAAASAATAATTTTPHQEKLSKGYDVGAVMTAAPGLAMRAPKELARRAAAWPTLLREGLLERAAAAGTTTPTTPTQTTAPLLPPSALNNRHAGVLTRPVPRVRERAGALGARLGPEAAALALSRAPALLSRRQRLVARRMHEVRHLLLVLQQQGPKDNNPNNNSDDSLAALVARAPRLLLTPPEALAARLDAVAAAMSGAPDAVGAALAAARAATRRRWVGSVGGVDDEEEASFAEAGVPLSLASWTEASIGWRTLEALELLEEKEGKAGGGGDTGDNNSATTTTTTALPPSTALRAALAAARACPAALMSKSPPAVRAHVEALQEVLFPDGGGGGDNEQAPSSSPSSPASLVAALLRAHPALLTRSANSVRSVAVTLTQHSQRAGGGGGDGAARTNASLAALDAAGLRSAALAAPSLLALSTSCLDSRLAAWEALAAGGARWVAALRDLRSGGGGAGGGPEAVARALTAPQARYARLAWLAEAAAREEPPTGGEGLEALVTWDDARFAREYPAFEGAVAGGGAGGGGGM